MLLSIIVLTKDRSHLLAAALESIVKQTFSDFEVVVVNDGSVDETAQVLLNWLSRLPLVIIVHPVSCGITESRQEALLASRGEFVAFLDDDDIWVDKEKLKKQIDYLNQNSKVVLVGGGIEVGSQKKFRPETDSAIRKSMLFRNNFFTSTVVFRKEVALKAGGFIPDWVDLVEDYDLWLRMGKLGQMHNFQESFAVYAKSSYNKDKFKKFLRKQFSLIRKNRNFYPNYFLASVILYVRVLFGF